MAFGSQRYSIVAGPDEITITGESKTLEGHGLVFSQYVRRIALVSANMSSISWANGTAVAGVNRLPDMGIIELESEKSLLAKFQFVTDGQEIKVSVVQEY